ncbi:hypothetical protein [Flexithrix dorotheae]|uniref:hypothetical protein n=1 Tax=Flexithrix dorotheae TaxID=70993 RepID=UPI0003797C71|nr:hypothetical protein [Flexithrix dorotheae]
MKVLKVYLKENFKNQNGLQLIDNQIVIIEQKNSDLEITIENEKSVNHFVIIKFKYQRQSWESEEKWMENEEKFSALLCSELLRIQDHSGRFYEKNIVDSIDLNNVGEENEWIYLRTYPIKNNRNEEKREDSN